MQRLKKRINDLFGSNVTNAQTDIHSYFPIFTPNNSVTENNLPIDLLLEKQPYFFPGTVKAPHKALGFQGGFHSKNTTVRCQYSSSATTTDIRTPLSRPNPPIRRTTSFNQLPNPCTSQRILQTDMCPPFPVGEIDLVSHNNGHLQVNCVRELSGEFIGNGGSCSH